MGAQKFQHIDYDTTRVPRATEIRGQRIRGKPYSERERMIFTPQDQLKISILPNFAYGLDTVGRVCGPVHCRLSTAVASDKRGREV